MVKDRNPHTPDALIDLVHIQRIPLFAHLFTMQPEGSPVRNRIRGCRRKRNPRKKPFPLCLGQECQQHFATGIVMQRKPEPHIHPNPDGKAAFLLLNDDRLFPA